MVRPCVWLERDDTGRPRCEHGWAHKAGDRWRCPLKATVNNRRWRRTEPGREFVRRRNASDSQRSYKALYELTRIRV